MHPRLSELLWEHDPNGLLVVDRSLAVHMVNPAFCRLFRVARELLQANTITFLVGEQVNPYYLAPAAAARRVDPPQRDHPDRRGAARPQQGGRDRVVLTPAPRNNT